jgi:hypothetical protein
VGLSVSETNNNNVGRLCASFGSEPAPAAPGGFATQFRPHSPPIKYQLKQLFAHPDYFWIAISKLKFEA